MSARGLAKRTRRGERGGGGKREEKKDYRGAGSRERVACINKSAVRAAGGGESRVILVHVRIVRGERRCFYPFGKLTSRRINLDQACAGRVKA